MKKSIHEWLKEYSESHQNSTNKLIHWFCVPLIFWSIISLLSTISNEKLDVFKLEILNDFSHFGSLVILLGLLFYLRLSFKIFLGMFFFSLLTLIDIFIANKIFGQTILTYISLFIFISAWIGQFIGHKIEKKKPSFLKDIQFLLIGPAWIISFIYDYFNIKY